MWHNQKHEYINKFQTYLQIKLQLNLQPARESITCYLIIKQIITPYKIIFYYTIYKIFIKLKM